jgi:hypothetical protein
MSLEEKQRIAEGEVALTLLFGGRKPSERALKKAPLLDSWTVRMDRYGQRRMLSLVGVRRLSVGDLSESPGELLWLDRKERFAVTYMGLWRLGARGDDIEMLVPPLEDDR